MFRYALRTLWAALGLMLGFASFNSARAETQTEIINESRTYLYFKVPDANAQSFLPAGWVVNPLATGAARGANFIIVLIDRHLATDPTGKPLNTNGVTRMAVLVVLGKNPQTGAAGSVVVGGSVADPQGVPGAYKVYTPASIVFDRSSKPGAGGQDSVEESWTVADSGDERLEVRLKYSRAAPVPAKFDSRTYSGADGNFYRIYRGDQGADVVLSAATNVNRATQAEVKASGQKLGKLLDGSQQLVNITYMPWYRRNTFLP